MIGIFKAFFKSNGKHSEEEIQKQIQEKAYELYVKRGCVPGYAQEDWIEAEKLVRGNR